MNSNSLQLFHSLSLKFNLNEQEKLALNLCYEFTEMLNKELQNYNHGIVAPKGNNPRNNLLFRHCIKLIDEAAEKKLPAEEFKFFLNSQIQMFKLIGLEKAEGRIPVITPAIICGPKAWKRLFAWRQISKRRWYVANADGVHSDMNTKSKVIQGIRKTKVLLERKLGVLNASSMAQAEKSGALCKWHYQRMISDHYILLSPLVKNKNFEFIEKFKPGITDDIQEWFKIEFANEFI